MERELLLTRSNFRKNKGTSIGLFILIFVSALLTGAALLMFFDAYPTAKKEAVRLDAGDCYIRILENVEGISDEVIAKLMEEDVSEYNSYHCLGYSMVSLPFGDGTIAPTLYLNNSDAFHKKMDLTEIVIQDDSVTGDYIYLPYQFFTSGGYQLGDSYSFELSGQKYTFTVKGFTNTTNWGCNNSGAYEFVLDDEKYDEIRRKEQAADAIIINIKLKEGVSVSKFNMTTADEIMKINGSAAVEGMEVENVLANKSFFSLIMAVCFLVATLILVIVVVFMMASCIANYIRENLKTIGVWKALGYTSRDIRNSLYLQFGLLAVTGSMLGSFGSYALMPVLSKFVVAQMGVPYTVSFHMGLTLASFAFQVVFVFLVAYLASRKIKTIEPVVALREGRAAHNFRKNFISLERSFLKLDMSLAMKTLCTNVKMNIITFLVVGLLIFSSALSFMFYENYNRNPKLETLSFEICSGVVSTDYETKDAVYEWLEERDDVSNTREIINVQLKYKDEDGLLAYVFDDVSKLNNKDVCYKGRIPKYDNEIAVSGKFCKIYGYEIGDELELHYGTKTYSYLITGLVQTCNNGGKEAILSKKASERIVDFTGMPTSYWFDCDGAEEESAQEILDDCVKEYGEHIISTVNFYETINGAMTTFRSLTTLMVFVAGVISVLIIVLVLYLLMKILLYNKRKDYGIYKALGFTSRNLIFQTALSFMPAIILSVVVFSIISYNTANLVMLFFMRMFGLMKCTFTIALPDLFISGAGIILVSFIIAVLLSGKIRKIEAYDMLTQE